MPGEFTARNLKKKRKKYMYSSKADKKHYMKGKRKDPLRGAPMGRGIVLKKKGVEQKQPHSGIIKCVKVQLIKNGKKVGAHCPRDKAINFIEEHDEVTIAGLGGSQRGQMGSIPGIRYKVVAVNGICLDQLRLGKKEKPKR